MDDSSDQPTWAEIRDLIRTSPKPPLRARLVERDGAAQRQAVIIHDGVQGWYLDTGSAIELTNLDARSTVIVEGSRVRAWRGFGVAINNEFKAAIQGTLIAYLEDSQGQIVAREPILGRPCWVAEVNGLWKDKPHAAFRIWVDEETGILLRIWRSDKPRYSLSIEELYLGKATERPPTPDTEELLKRLFGSRDASDGA
jgi:hypothetical protein